jgi:ClpP class serine protease
MNKGNTAALFVGINSGSKDSIVQASLIGERLQRKAKDLGVPLITHAEDSALGPAFHLLMHGDTVLADKATFVGNIGFRMTPWMLKNFAESNQIHVKYVHHGENKVRFN